MYDFTFNKVRLISHSKFINNPDITVDPTSNLLDQIAYIARVSNPSCQAMNLNSEKLCDYLLKHNHFSPFEMCNIVLEIETTRDISRQILRHRSFSFQEFSARYADPTKELGFTTRDCRLQHDKNRQMSLDIENLEDNEIQKQFTTLQNELIEKEKQIYQFCIDHNIAKEQARVILSEGLIRTKLYMSGSVRSWIHYIQIRGDVKTTQREHYDIAIKCREEISKIFPLINKICS